ncbi:NAD(P)H-dependent oxidoreductase [Tamlana agarivorans]|uniref:NAD(P)H-dependent oxidoreductase n=1 Tax=Pseudotamlana agarivorans TaxID=481183 RepID=A0ACC5UCM5_9FLAO|nr:NAD(P)H-dependent oxidoreductase [Tamlana agarivorans]MBU2952021.1 NAD(P)H-dependent oxidoreductase [Tamlana agarivorans]
MKTVVISGSSRNDGHTKVLTDQLVKNSGWDFINLNDYNFSYYDYEHLNSNDDYIPLMREIIQKYDCLVFVTPVYWYAMSGIMKVFFDRFTDLLTIEKDLGRQLRGKHLAVISSSIGEHLGDQFWLPFKETAKYLGMIYIGNIHTFSGEDNTKKISGFVDLVDLVENNSK